MRKVRIYNKSPDPGQCLASISRYNAIVGTYWLFNKTSVPVSVTGLGKGGFDVMRGSIFVASCPACASKAPLNPPAVHAMYPFHDNLMKAFFNNIFFK